MRSFYKILIALSAVILLAAGCNTAQPKPRDPGLDDTNLEQSQTGQPATTSPGQTSNPATQPKPNVPVPDFVQDVERPTGPAVTQTVEGSNLNLQKTVFAEGETAIDILKREHVVETKNYGSGLGEMVLAIDGIKPDNKRFWAFYINGKSSNIGASTYKLKDGDKIEWKIEEIK